MELLNKTEVIVYPNAKINIGLNVINRRVDGYHNLETIFSPINIFDLLEVRKNSLSSGVAFSSSGLMINGKAEDNLVVCAAHLLMKDFETGGIKIHLHKQIPWGAGLGGGSSDAAYTLKAINELFKLNLSISQLETYAAQLGSDCPFFVQNKPCFATGRGEVMNPVNLSLKGLWSVVVKPPFGVSTVEAYRGVQPQQPEHSLCDLIRLPIEEWSTHIKNDFEKSVFVKYPQIEQIKRQMYDLGAAYASMSGSGSAVFGLFHTRPMFISSEIFKESAVFVAQM